MNFTNSCVTVSSLESHHMSFLEVYDVVRCAKANEMNMEKREIETALKMLSDGSGVVRKVGDSAGGMYVIGRFCLGWNFLQCFLIAQCFFYLSGFYKRIFLGRFLGIDFVLFYSVFFLCYCSRCSRTTAFLCGTERVGRGLEGEIVDTV